MGFIINKLNIFLRSSYKPLSHEMTEYMVRLSILASYGMNKFSKTDCLCQTTRTKDKLLEKMKYFNTEKKITGILMYKDIEL